MSAEMGADDTIPVAPARPAARPAATPAARPAVSPTAQAPAEPPPAKAPTAAPFVFPFQQEQKDILGQFLGYKLPTEAERQAARAAGIAQFEQEVPDRLKFMEKELKEKGEKLAGERASNINLSLAEAGLRMLGSRSPTLAGVIGEGGTGALRSFREGVSDIRKGEEALTQSKIAYAQAQTLYDERKYAAGDRRMQQFEDNQAKGLALLSSKNAALVQNMTSERERYLTPKLGDLYSAQAEYYRNRPTGDRISDADQKAAEDAAKSAAILKGGIGSPEYQREYDRVYTEFLTRRMQSNIGILPKPSGPIVRGSPNAPLGAP